MHSFIFLPTCGGHKAQAVSWSVASSSLRRGDFSIAGIGLAQQRHQWEERRKALRTTHWVMGSSCLSLRRNLELSLTSHADSCNVTS